MVCHEGCDPPLTQTLSHSFKPYYLPPRETSGAAGGPSPAVAAAAAGAEATAAAGWQLKHQTFRRLAERYGGVGASGMAHEHPPSSQQGGGGGPRPQYAGEAAYPGGSNGGGARGEDHDGPPVSGMHMNKHRHPEASSGGGEITAAPMYEQYTPRPHEVALYMGGSAGGAAGHELALSRGPAAAFANFAQQLKQQQQQNGPPGGAAGSGAELPPVASRSHFLLDDEEEDGGPLSPSLPLVHLSSSPPLPPYQPPVALAAGGGLLSAETAAAAPHLTDPSVTGMAPYAASPYSAAPSPYAVPAAAAAVFSSAGLLPQYSPPPGHSHAAFSMPPEVAPLRSVNSAAAGGGGGGGGGFASAASYSSGGHHLPLSSVALEPTPAANAGTPPPHHTNPFN